MRRENSILQQLQTTNTRIFVILNENYVTCIFCVFNDHYAPHFFSSKFFFSGFLLFASHLIRSNLLALVLVLVHSCEELQQITVHVKWMMMTSQLMIIKEFVMDARWNTLAICYLCRKFTIMSHHDFWYESEKKKKLQFLNDNFPRKKYIKNTVLLQDAVGNCEQMINHWIKSCAIQMKNHQNFKNWIDKIAETKWGSLKISFIEYGMSVNDEHELRC